MRCSLIGRFPSTSKSQANPPRGDDEVDSSPKIRQHCRRRDKARVGRHGDLRERALYGTRLRPKNRFVVEVNVTEIASMPPLTPITSPARTAGVNEPRPEGVAGRTETSQDCFFTRPRRSLLLLISRRHDPFPRPSPGISLRREDSVTTSRSAPSRRQHRAAQYCAPNVKQLKGGGLAAPFGRRRRSLTDHLDVLGERLGSNRFRTTVETGHPVPKKRRFAVLKNCSSRP